MPPVTLSIAFVKPAPRSPAIPVVLKPCDFKGVTLLSAMLISPYALS
jgi:hypothetical protein